MLEVFWIVHLFAFHSTFFFRSLWESDVLSVFHSTYFCLFRFCVGVTCARFICLLLLLLLLKISRNILKSRTEVLLWDKFYWPNLLPALHKMLKQCVHSFFFLNFNIVDGGGEETARHLYNCSTVL